MTELQETMQPPTTATSVRDNTAANKPNPGRRWTVVMAVLLAVAPLLYTAARREVSRWYLAAANHATYREDHTASLEEIQKALEWNPGDPELRVREIGAWLRLGKAHKAAAESDDYLKRVEGQYAKIPTDRNKANLITALNQSAYSHALANTDLEQALKNVSRSIRMFPGDSSLIDTRGYLHHLLGNNEDAIKDTELAVAIFRRRIQDEKLDQQDTRLFVDKTKIESMKRDQNETLAVLMHHRGLAYEAVGRTDEATGDFEMAEELGYDPENGVW